jgi:hypothetical protein
MICHQSPLRSRIGWLAPAAGLKDVFNSARTVVRSERAFQDNLRGGRIVAKETHATISDPGAIAALTHPVRLNLLNHLMASGPATASACARAVGDTPSNCSYHLRLLAKHGWVAAGESADARERPWRALITGFSVGASNDDPDSPSGRRAAALAALSLHRDQQLARDALTRLAELSPTWRRAATHNSYTLRMTAAELTELAIGLDALIRPYIAATRDDADAASTLVHLDISAFPTAGA